jgi:DNA-binding NtrC family response regulator
VLECNAAAAQLLGDVAANIEGHPLAGIIAEGADTLTHAFAAEQPMPLPPFLVRRGDNAQLVVAGLFMPEQPGRAGLLLWPLLDECDLSPLGEMGQSDVVAVLGVDRLRYDAAWSAADTARLLVEVQASLLEIVRPGDNVAPPAGAAVVMLLRDVDVTGARDICRALLSHLHGSLARPGTPYAALRFCVGLAHPETGGTPLATLLAANNALLQAQNRNDEPVREAALEDSGFIAGRAMTAAGLFGGTLDRDAPEHAVDMAAASTPVAPPEPPIAPIERDIGGYVEDNMEGAVDQAVFLARLDIPVAIIGPAGTGKMYVARVIHDASGASPDMFVPVDCRDFRSRNAANSRISRELQRGEGKTLVFKSPHVMNAEAQMKLARQISTRMLADVSPARYLPSMKLVALFPDKLETLLRKGQLTEQLAGAFAGFPIHVPPIRDRKQAVLRWAHKILGQECATRDRNMKGFTPDAEQAMLSYDWPGNISEMRQCINDALEKTDKDWLTPVDLGLFRGISAEGAPSVPEAKPFLALAEDTEGQEDAYRPSALEAVDVALGEAVHDMLELNMIKPLGAWLEDELVLAALDRYRGDLRRAADFLHTKSRNISRWLAKIETREDERTASSLWQSPRRLLREWVRESPQLDGSPLTLMQDKLLAHVANQCGALSNARRAQVMGVSTPTYAKRLREAQLVQQPNVTGV